MLSEQSVARTLAASSMAAAPDCPCTHSQRPPDKQLAGMTCLVDCSHHRCMHCAGNATLCRSKRAPTCCMDTRLCIGEVFSRKRLHGHVLGASGDHHCHLPCRLEEDTNILVRFVIGNPPTPQQEQALQQEMADHGAFLRLPVQVRPQAVLRQGCSEKLARRQSTAVLLQPRWRKTLQTAVAEHNACLQSRAR